MPNTKPIPHDRLYIRKASAISRTYKRNYRRNSDYEMWGTRYAHVEIWRAHHGIALDPKVFVIHHKDLDKRNNAVCGDEPRTVAGKKVYCLLLNCGNLAPMTRADHIREHRPGKMSGVKGFVDTKPRKRRGVAA